MPELSNIQWLTDSLGERVVGIRRTTRTGDTGLELYLPDGRCVGVVTRDKAARLIDMLQTGTAFADIVGDARFGLDVSDL